MYDCLVFQEGAFIEEGNFVEKWFFGRQRRLAMLKVDFFFRMPHFVLEMFAGLKMFLDIAKPLSDGAMVSQIVWLGMKDVFTQIAKEVVGQGLDHGRRSLRGLIQNQCRVSCRMIACSDVTEGNETQKPVCRMAKI
ncbi:hypothetical protein F2Q69_00035782 [Brassica cretica]|uniref:Uncharacterized protein n=1 Tax=Brassica cretica TaxID=69181 RepID=A0A8S9SHD5_BRACR|nr:hypothetical protein F2Q69_00035782 [Brassica cretica]